MTFANLLVGLSIGLPIMIAVGPISVLLLDQGLERGLRTTTPAVFGVASADLTFSIVAAVGGASVSALLTPISGWLTLGAVAVLVWLAVDLGRSGLAELRVSRADEDRADENRASSSQRSQTCRIAVGSVDAGTEPAVGLAVLDRPEPAAAEQVAASIPFGHLRGLRLAGAFYGLTMVNPLTIVLFASVVIAGGAGVGTAGWALGMALASLIAHGSFAVLGGVLGTALSPAATARLRLVAAIFMAGLAVHFLMG